MNKLKQLLLLMLLSLCSMASYAYDFEVDGLYYNLLSASDRTCELVGSKSGMTEIIIPATVTTRGITLTVSCIKDYAFENNTSISDLKVNAPIAISECAFSGCSNLRSVNLCNGVRSLRKKAFYGCPVESLSIPNTCDTIGLDAINKVETVIIEDGEASIRTEGQAESMSKLYMGRNIEHGFPTPSHPNFTLGNDNKGVSFTPSSICGRSLQVIEIGEGPTFISESLFAGCEKIRKIVIPSNIAEIHDNAFKECNGLTEIIFADAETCINIGYNYDETFGSTSQKDFYRPYGILTYYRKKYAPFSTCPISVLHVGRTLERWTNPTEGLRIYDASGTGESYHHDVATASINSELFFQEDCISNITWGSKLFSISDYLLKEQSNISSIDIPANCERIGMESFGNCDHLKNISISCKNIGDYAFIDCVNMETVNLLTNKTEIGKGAFVNCESLTYIDFDKISTIQADAFDGCASFKQINLSAVKSIEDGAFKKCTNLHKVELGDNISIIPNNCFSGCESLQWISFGRNLAQISNGAFGNCKQISSIGIKSSTPPSFYNKLEFADINKFNATLYIPEGSTSAYEQADVWKDFLFKEEKPIPDFVYNLPKPGTSDATSKNMVVKGELTGALINQINASKQIEALDLQAASIVLDNQNAYYETGKRIEDPYLYGDDVDVYRNAPYYSYKYYTAPTTVSGSDKEYSKSGKLINVITTCFSSELTNANLNGNLKRIKLPSSLIKLGENAIVGTSLTELYATSTIPPTAIAASFGNTNKSTCVLYVPEGCKSAYASATGWKDFKNIVEVVSDNYISVQPTNEDRKVQLARQDNKAKYQWYKYVEKTNKVIDITNLLSTSSGCWESIGNGWQSNMHVAESAAILSYEHNFNVGDVLSFDWSVSSEEAFDQLQCYLGDELLFVASGEKNGSFNKTIEAAVSDKLTFVYIKDNTIDSANDNAQISNVKISSSQEQTLQVPEAIDGETGNVLQAGAVSVGDKVFCIVTLFDGKQLKSNEFVIEKLPIPSDNYCLVLEKKDGSLEKYVLSDRPEITFSNSTLVVSSEKVQTDCPLDYFVRFYFEENNTDGISVNTASTFVFKYNDNMVCISGAEKAEVYSADGMKLMDQHATNSEIRMNICNLTPGLYVIKTDKKSIKIRK